MILTCAAATAVIAQSTSAAYPTPVSTNEIEGSIRARDLGDARLTSYYYTFNGSQGDIFVNISAANFNGDVDIFVAADLRPLTKISFYADSSVGETGRVVYLRKPEKLILRVQGRTPDDNPATFKIKFAGSFVAVEGGGNQPEEPKLPEINAADSAGGIRVNSVGTIIKPEPTPKAVETTAQNDAVRDDQSPATSGESSQAATAENNPTGKTEDTPAEKTEEVKAEPEPEKNATAPGRRTTPARNPRRRAGARTTPTARAKTTTPPKTNQPKAAAAEEAQPNPLENVRMVVLMKTGERLEFPMTEVFRFTMNNGTLTITTKDGKIIRKSILDIQEFSVK